MVPNQYDNDRAQHFPRTGHAERANYSVTRGAPKDLDTTSDQR
jgi:hypothetical protein